MTRRGDLASGKPLAMALGRRRLLAGVGAGAGWMFAARAGVLAAQGTPAASPAAGEWSFTDDRDRTVTLPELPRNVVAQVSAAAALWDYGLRPVGIFGPSRREDGSPDPQAGGVDLDQVTSIGEAYGQVDIEALIALDPDLLVSQMYPGVPLWYLDADSEPLVEQVVPTIGILVQETPLDSVLARFEELAAALGADLESPENTAAKEAFLAAEADLKAAIAEKPDLTVLVVAGSPDVAYVANPELVADLLYFRSLGLNVVQPETDEFWDDLSWEEINTYPADLILSDARTQSLTIEQLGEIPIWNTLPAVQAGQVARWHAEPSYSYRGYTPVIIELTEAIRNADPDIVP